MRLDYIALTELKKLPRNPKEHDLGAIHGSIDVNGWHGALLVDERSGYLAAGHGRLDALMQKKLKGQPAPRGIRVQGDEWLVPVVVDHFESDQELQRYIVADNRTTELGGWDEDVLADVLSDLAQEDALEGSGFDTDDLDTLLKGMADDVLGASWDRREEYGFIEGGPEADAPGTRQGSGYPLAIVLSRDEYQRWLGVKQGMSVKDDKTCLLRLMATREEVA